MTVIELIEHLSTMNPDLLVHYFTDMGFVEPLTKENISVINQDTVNERVEIY